MTKFTMIAMVALTTSLLAVGHASAIGGFAAPGGGGGGGGGGGWPMPSGSSGQVASPGDAFYPNGAPQSREEACHEAGGEMVIQIEDGRTRRICML